MAETAHQHHHGAQEISEQIRTYGAFGTLTKWGSLGIAALLLLLVTWFCTSAGFLSGLIAAVVLLAAGVFFLRDKPAEDH
jgi:uncharacterized membrane protein